jgi:hypothetical protein
VPTYNTYLLYENMMTVVWDTCNTDVIWPMSHGVMTSESKWGLVLGGVLSRLEIHSGLLNTLTRQLQ